MNADLGQYILKNSGVPDAIAHKGFSCLYLPREIVLMSANISQTERCRT